MDNDLLMCIYQICNIIIHLFTPLIPPLPNPTDRPINQSFPGLTTSSQCPPCVSLNHIPFHLPEHKTTPSFYLLLLLLHHLTNWFCVFFFFSCVPPYLAHHLFSFFASLPPSHSNATQPLIAREESNPSRQNHRQHFFFFLFNVNDSTPCSLLPLLPHDEIENNNRKAVDE